MTNQNVQTNRHGPQNSYDLCLFCFVGFLFLLVSGKGCGLWALPGLFSYLFCDWHYLYQKPLVFSVSVLCIQIFNVKLILRPKHGLTQATYIVLWFTTSATEYLSMYVLVKFLFWIAVRPILAFCLMIFRLWFRCFECVLLSLLCLGLNVLGNCIDSWSLPSFLFYNKLEYWKLFY